MPALTLNLLPDTPALDLLAEPQVCYVLVTAGVRGGASAWPVSWALVADASRSMRIPIVDEAQFRELVRRGGAQETLVDGVPVWQLTGAVPPEVRAAFPSALGYVARALHTVVEQLDGQDRFALVACAEDAVLLAPAASGADRAGLARGIDRLPDLDLGDETDLARGLARALAELREARRAPGAGRRVERVLLLTDGFTRRPEACLELAGAAAAERIPITTIGLGGEFQDALLTALADRGGGRALFLPRAEEIPRAVAAELALARSVAVRGATLLVTPAAGVELRRVTRARPALAVLAEGGAPGEPREVALGDLGATPVAVLLELVAPARPAGRAPLATVTLLATDAAPLAAEVQADYRPGPPPIAPAVLDAAARASAARLQRRAAALAGKPAESARLLRAAASQLDALGEHALADAARSQASAAERTGRVTSLATRELTYATRRLGGE